MNMEKEVLTLNIEDILPNRFQPRIKFKEENINELAESIKEHGVIQPIVVRKISDKYEIIAGERRYKASILAGKTTIPAIVTDLDDKDSAEVALIENIQRQNLTPIEEAVSYKKILDMGYINQTDLADKLGKTQSTIANKLRLLNLDEEVQEALLNEKISERHARSLLRLDRSKQVGMLNRIISERMTVRKTDEEISKLLNPLKEPDSNLEINKQSTISSNSLTSLPPEEDNNIEILDFDLTDPESQSNASEINENVQTEDLEKTMEIPIIKEEKEEGNNMNNENNQLNIPSEPIIETIQNQPDFNNMNSEPQITEIPQSPNISDISSLNINQNDNMNQQMQPNIPFNQESQTIDNQQINQYSSFTPEPPVVNPPVDQITPFTSEQGIINNQQSSLQSEQQPINDVNNSQTFINQEINNISQSIQPIDSNQTILTNQNEQQENSQPQGGKFFNMFNTNNENLNYVDDIEQKEVNMNFDDNNDSESGQSINPFNFNFNPINNQESSINNNSQSTPANNIDSMNIFNQQTTPMINNQELNNQSEDPFQNKLNPYSLNDEQQFTNINNNFIDNNNQQGQQNVFPNEPELFQPQVEINNVNPQQNINFQPEINPVNNQTIPQEKFVTGDFKMVINTIINCADTIEKYGFKIDTEELDFEDIYQVTFKIYKK